MCQSLAQKPCELESLVVNIIKLNRLDRPNIITTGMVYCGRNRSRYTDYFNPMDLGLGNPFSHKKTKNCVWKTNSLEDCLNYYRHWLWRLIQNENSRYYLTDWEQVYLNRFLDFCQSISLGRVNTLVCFCINTYHNALNKTEIYCHTQILWNAAIWYNCQRFS